MCAPSRSDRLLVITAALILAYEFAYYNETVEVLWTFSIFLEVVAMLPQLLLMRTLPCACVYDATACCVARPTGDGRLPAVLSRSCCLPSPALPAAKGLTRVAAGPATADNGLVWFWALCMALYRGFYLLNWIWKYQTQENYWDPIVSLTAYLPMRDKCSALTDRRFFADVGLWWLPLLALPAIFLLLHSEVLMQGPSGSSRSIKGLWTDRW